MVLMVSCENKEPKAQHVYSFLHDITDPMIAQPDANEFLSLIDAADIKLRYRIISDVDFNPVTETKRSAPPSGLSSLFSNSLEEKKKKKSFEVDCKKILVKKDPIEGEAHSSIFDPLMAELEYLSSLSDHHKKHLIIYSDLLDNCRWISFYRGTDRWLLANHPNKVVQRYQKRVSEKLKEIKNVEVHIIFIPENHYANVRFKQLQKVYLALFSELNIPISFSGNLTNALSKL